MIKLAEGWGEPKKDSEGEDDGFKKEEGEGVGFFSLSSTPLTRPSSTSPNSLLAAHSKWRPSNEHSNKRVFLHQKTPALQARSEFQNWILQLCNLQLVLSPQDVIYGIIRQLNQPCLALNHLIILGKYFLYVNALNTEKSSLIDFKRLVQDKRELEKYIAVTSDQQKLFFAKWQNFAHFC